MSNKIVHNKLTELEIRNRIQEDGDFINSKMYNFSIKELLKAKPNGVTDRLAAGMLMITLEEFNVLHQEAIKDLREQLGVML